MACSNIRYGAGVTQEVGMDLVNLGAKNVGVYTDKNLAGEDLACDQVGRTESRHDI